MADERAVATYADRLVQVQREFALYDDRVVVTARWLSGRQFQNVVDLEGLRPEESRFFVRYKLYRLAGWVLAVGMLMAAAAVYMGRTRPMGTLAYIGAAVAFVGFVLAAASYRNRRILFARFVTSDGKPGVDMAKAGPRRHEFEAFVQKMRKQIRARGWAK